MNLPNLPRAPRSCAKCGSLVAWGKKCPICQRRRGTTTERGYGAPWRQLRLLVLDRDGYRCRWCGGPANSVDHITPKTEGGTDDPGNLAAACLPCNSRRSALASHKAQAEARRARDAQFRADARQAEQARLRAMRPKPGPL
jgi:5-methylcytosine-specific restriction protein A